MRLNNQQTQSRRRRIAAAARAEHAAKAPRAEYASAPVVEVATENLPADVAHERRGLDRVSMRGEIIVRRIGGFNFEVALRDLSAHGCQVELLGPVKPATPLSPASPSSSRSVRAFAGRTARPPGSNSRRKSIRRYSITCWAGWTWRTPPKESR